MIRFYDALEKAVKRHRPEAYIPWAAARMRAARDDIKKFAQTPPYRILHSAEANCAFHKEGYSEPVVWQAIAKIMNVYQDYPDLLQTATIPEKLERFFLIMDREQTEFQHRASWEYMGRIWQLFVNNPQSRTMSDALLKSFGLSCKEWIQVCFLAWAAAQQTEECAFTKSAILRYERLPMSEQAVDAFFRQSTCTPRDIGVRFREIRKKVPYKFHSLIRSTFFEYPIVRFADGRMVSPCNDILFRHSGQGLYRMAKELKEFNTGFGGSFEAYVRTILECISQRLTILGERELKQATNGKICDFLLELPDVLLLVECKACTFTANLLTDVAIANDNSTGKVAKAIQQLCATACALDSGLARSLNVDATKEVIGVVVTFGDVALANSEWYFTRFFLGRAERHSVTNLFPCGRMVRRPIVMSITAFEILTRMLNAGAMSLSGLYSERERQPYYVVGDWPAYLRDVLNKLKMAVPKLSFVESCTRELWASLGIRDDEFADAKTSDS